MLYKVGDKVKIVSKYNGGNWAESMDAHLGKVMTIKYAYSGSDYPYRMEEDAFWSWSDDMIEGLAKNDKNKKENKQMKKDADLGIKQVIYNPPATVVQWKDGSKTVVKTTNNDEYDPIFGYLMAYFQKHSGLSKTQVGKLCDKVVEDFSVQQEKKNNKPVVKDEFNEEYC